MYESGMKLELEDVTRDAEMKGILGRDPEVTALVSYRIGKREGWKIGFFTAIGISAFVDMLLLIVLIIIGG